MTSRRAWFVAFLLLLPIAAGAEEQVTPHEWQNRPLTWVRDANWNRVDDRIDAIAATSPTQLVKVNIAFRFCFGQVHLDSVRKYAGICMYRSPVLTFGCWDSLRAGLAIKVANFADSSVAFIEMSDPLQPSLATAVPAIKASDARTVHGLNGTGINIAFIDTGIDDGLHAALPSTKFRGGMNVFTAIPGVPIPDANPTDLGGHGTAMAAAAVGTGAGGVAIGVAPMAGLYDVRVTPFGGGSVPQLFLLRALGEIIARVSDGRWTVHVVCIGLSLLSPTPSTGIEPLPMLINTLVGRNVSVVVPMGNGVAPGTVLVDGVASARDAITVGATAHSGTVSAADDVVASYSRRGTVDSEKPDLVAPGSVTVAGCTPAQMCTNPPGAGCGVLTARGGVASGACELSGTSISAALTAGVVAQLRQLIPRAGTLRIKNILMASGVDKGAAGWDVDYGAGEVDVMAAVDLVGAPTDVMFDPPGSNPEVNWESASVRPRDQPPILGVPNAIQARVKNNGTGLARNIEVVFTVSPLGNHKLMWLFAGAPLGPRNPREVGRTTIATLDPGEDTTAAVPWTPNIWPEGTTEWPIWKPGTQYQSFSAVLDYEADTDGWNNAALLSQRVFRHTPSMGPMAATDIIANVINPEPRDYSIQVVPQVALGSGWSYSATPSAFPLSQDGCYQPVTVSLARGAGGSNYFSVRWFVLGTPPSGPGPADTLGGFTTDGEYVVPGSALPGLPVATMYASAAALVGVMLAVSWARRRRRSDA